MCIRDRFTSDNAKKVLKVSFMLEDEQGGTYIEHAAAYANPEGTVTLPEEPISSVYDFIKWSMTNSADGTEFTAQTLVTKDIAVYAIGQEMYGETDHEKTITITYGAGATQDLSDYMTYAGNTDAAEKFTYEITNRTAVNGNTINASISGDTLTIPADTNADTYTLTIQATEKASVIAPFSVDYDTQPVTITITVVVNKAKPTIVTEPEASRVRRGRLLSTSDLAGGVVNGLEGLPLEGTWTWQNDREMTETGTFNETAVFTPTNTNYESVEVVNIPVTVYRSSSGGGSSTTTYYTVTFDTQGGSVIDSVRVAKNATASEPKEPSRDGYTFAGWFTNKEYTTAYDFDSKVTENITLYAKWTEEVVEPGDPTDPSGWDNPFTDVAEDDWFYDAVRYVETNDLFSGITDTTFAPNEAITRGMMVTVLWRNEGKPAVDYRMTFEDVAPAAYYAEAVRWAASEGIVKGCLLYTSRCV